MSRKSKLNLRKLLEETQELKPKADEPLRINNIVGNVQLLEEGYSLCLESLSLYLNGMAKYRCKSFAATVIRVKDSISATTCLVFRSGNINVVGAQSVYHSLLACQIYRQIIESVPAIYANPDEGGKLGMYDLVGRTVFLNWSISNIVANYNLNCQPNLRYLSSIAPEISAWKHDLFPGLRLLVWLSPKDQCRCPSGGCRCNCRAIIFDTGQVVVIGCKDIVSLNMCLSRIRLLFADTDMTRQHPPTEIEFGGFVGSKSGCAAFGTTASTNKNGTNTKTSIDFVLKGLKRQLTRKTTLEKDKDPNLPVLVKGCKYNQLDNVKFMAEIQTEKEIAEAITYCKNNIDIVDNKILEFLIEFKKIK